MSDFVYDGGAGDGIWNTNANWAGGTAPTSGSHNIYIAAGSIPISVGPTGTPSFDLVEVQGGFGDTASGVALGTESVSLVFGTVTTLRIANLRCRFMKFGGTYTTVYADELGGASLYFSSGAVTTLYGGTDGNIIVEDNVTLTNFSRAGGPFTIKGDASSPADLVADISAGASGEIWRRVAKAYNSGKVTLAYAAEVAISAGAAEFRNGSGGSLNLKQTGNISKIIAFSGSSVSAIDHPGGSGTKPTITDLVIHRGSKVRLPTSKITVTNQYFSGVEDAPPG